MRTFLYHEKFCLSCLSLVLPRFLYISFSLSLPLCLHDFSVSLHFRLKKLKKFFPTNVRISIFVPSIYRTTSFVFRIKF